MREEENRGKEKKRKGGKTLTETRYKVSHMIQVQRRMDIKQIQLPAREPTSALQCPIS